MKHIGKTIKLLRVASRLKQKELARMAGISQNYLSLIESDRKEPSLQVIERISARLGVPIAGIFLLSMDTPTGLSGDETTLFASLRDLVWQLAQRSIA